jgi:hypothetical protein
MTRNIFFYGIMSLMLAVFAAPGLCGQPDSTGTISPGRPTGDGCVSVFVDDSTIRVSCPDSTTVQARVFWKGKHLLLARNPYLGVLSFQNRKGGGPLSWEYQQKEFRADPLCDRTLLNQTAFLRREYPACVSLTDVLLMSIDASVTPQTQIYANCIFPNLPTFSEYTVGAKQQLFVSRQGRFALALDGALTHPDFWDPKYGNPRYIGTAKIIASYNFFPGAAIHGGIMYTFQKKYHSDSSYADGTTYHTFYGYRHQDLGYFCSIECQPFTFAKILAEFSTDYGPSVEEGFPRTGFAALGSRFLFRSFVLDAGIGEILFASKYSSHGIFPFPILRLSWFIGNGK